jgi:hypothetical protein
MRCRSHPDPNADRERLGHHTDRDFSTSGRNSICNPERDSFVDPDGKRNPIGRTNRGSERITYPG